MCLWVSLAVYRLSLWARRQNEKYVFFALLFLFLFLFFVSGVIAAVVLPPVPKNKSDWRTAILREDICAPEQELGFHMQSVPDIKTKGFCWPRCLRLYQCIMRSSRAKLGDECADTFDAIGDGWAWKSRRGH